MGRITVFSANDLNSFKITKGLERRTLPFSLIDVTLNPETINGLRSLTSSRSVPQVFFNTRYVGGLKETLDELALWDDTSLYTSPRERFDKQIAVAPDPSNPKLAVPEKPSVKPLVSVMREPTPSVELPDGTMTTVCDITEKLKNTLPIDDIKTKGKLYRNCFTGKAAVAALTSSLGITESLAVTFGNALLKAKVFHPVGSITTMVGAEVSFKSSGSNIYRLQCHMQPDVLNSYRVWSEPAKGTCVEVLDALDDHLTKVEYAAVDGLGKVDHAKINRHDFAMFEEAVCELQKVESGNLSDKETVAFSLNLFRFMMRYAFIKIGICTNEADRVGLLQQVKFNLGGLVYSLQEWTDGVLRANTKSSFASKPSFNVIDRRRKYALSKLDYRIHFAINAGASMGSSFSLPFRKFTAGDIDDQLEIAANVFCGDNKNVMVKKKSKEVKVSKIFAWYRSDFDKNDSKLLDLIANHLDGTKKSNVKAAETGFKIRFVDVNYTRNAANYSVYNKAATLSEVTGIKSLFKRFQPPKTPKNEELRLATLRSLNLLDTLPEERFDRITRMVKCEFDVPLVFVSLVDANRQWFKSVQWHCPLPQASETGRDVSFCGHAIHSADDEIFLIENALEDDRFADNPLVKGDLGIRFYAGAPLYVTPTSGGDAVCIGTLCIIDQKPRTLSEAQLAKFRSFGQQIRNEIVRRDGLDDTPSNRTGSLMSDESLSSSA